jgi:hypothetical protein
MIKKNLMKKEGNKKHNLENIMNLTEMKILLFFLLIIKHVLNWKTLIKHLFVSY